MMTILPEQFTEMANEIDLLKAENKKLREMQVNYALAVGLVFTAIRDSKLSLDADGKAVKVVSFYKEDIEIIADAVVQRLKP